MIYLFPTEMEAALFRRSCPDAEVVICGVGMAAAAATMSRLTTRNEEVVLAGIAGSYGETPLLSVVEVVSEVVGDLPERFALHYTVEPHWGLPAVSSNTVSSCNTIYKGCRVENMEGAAIFAVCQANNIPVSQIRAISNFVDAPFAEWQINEAIEALTKTLISLKT